nr:MAG TPA: Big defensin [Caudoviricetes sp.]
MYRSQKETIIALNLLLVKRLIKMKISHIILLILLILLLI